MCPVILLENLVKAATTLTITTTKRPKNPDNIHTTTNHLQATILNNRACDITLNCNLL